MVASRQPERTCVGCRSTASKPELLRVVRDREGRVRVDQSGKAAGRGAYVHRSASCLREAGRTGALGRALRAELPGREAARLVEELREATGVQP